MNSMNNVFHPLFKRQKLFHVLHYGELLNVDDLQHLRGEMLICSMSGGISY